MHLLKKYPNRRIYDTENSCYITLADVRRMVLERKSLQVVDSKTGKDLTRSVLLQVIAEMEAEGHQSLLTNRVLEELIRFYGDKMVGMLGPFLERQVVGFLSQQDRLREHLRGLTGGMPLPAIVPVPNTDQLIETLTQQYQQLLQPFTGKRAAGARKDAAVKGASGKKTAPRGAADGENPSSE
ncbi:MAG: polyhydroxyalkanoate synthesis repressor PhaR [Porticoccaceae bacterium]